MGKGKLINEMEGVNVAARFFSREPEMKWLGGDDVCEKHIRQVGGQSENNVEYY